MLGKISRSYHRWERLLSCLFVAFIAVALVSTLIGKLFGSDGIVASSTVYTEGVVGQLPTINPLFTDVLPVNRDISRLVFESLVNYNPEKQQFEPGIATYSINDDVTEYVFKIKKDVFWHDGEPVTADDVFFTFNDVIKHPNFPNKLLQLAFNDVQVVKVADDTVSFRLAQPNAFFLSNMIVGVVPYHVFGEIPVEMIGSTITEDTVIGAGPYKFEGLVNLDDGVVEVSLSRYSDYYLGKPKLKKIRFLVFPTEDALLSRQDILSSLPLVSDNAAELLDQKFGVTDYQLPQYTGLFLNQSNPVLSSERMRKILKNAFDKNYLTEGLKNKQAIGGPYFFLEKIDRIPERDLVPLKEALEDNGWVLGSNGVRENLAGDQLRFILLVKQHEPGVKTDETNFVVDHIVDAGKELGIKIDVDEASPQVFAAKLVNKAYDIVLTGQDFGYNLDAYSFWHSSQVGPDTVNLSNFSSVSADAVLEELRKTRGQEEQRALLEKLNIILKAEAPAIFLYTQKYLFAFDNTVKNRTILNAYATITDRFYGVHEWKLR